MRYDRPEWRERLAAEYVLGTMPSRMRRRFERLIAGDPALARVVGDWADRLAPLDDATPPEEPPVYAWQRSIDGPQAPPRGTLPDTNGRVGTRREGGSAGIALAKRIGAKVTALTGLADFFMCSRPTCR